MKTRLISLASRTRAFTLIELATYGKLTDFSGSHGRPSTIFLTVDESPWSINDAVLAVSAAQPKSTSGEATRSSSTARVLFAGPSYGKAVPASDPDWTWLWRHSTLNTAKPHL